MAHKIAYVGAPLGFEMEGVVQIPVLRIDYQDLSKMNNIGGVVVFTSKRGIISLKKSNVSIRCDRAYCIGEQTSRYLKEIYSIDCIVPAVQTTEGLAELLIGSETSVNVVASDHIDRKFIERMESRGIDVKYIVSYKISENKAADYEPLRDSDKVLFGSSKSFEILYRNGASLLDGKEIYAIGKPTEETIMRHGYGVAESFETPNIRAILSKLITKR